MLDVLSKALSFVFIILLGYGFKKLKLFSPTDYKIIVKDEEKVLKRRAEKEDFIPNFVNPFRTQGQELSSVDVDDQE